MHLADNDRAFDARVFRDLTDRGLEGACGRWRCRLLVFVVAFQTDLILEGSAAGRCRRRDDAFFHGRAGGVQGVVDAVLRSFTSTSVAPPTLDDGNAAGQLGQTLLQLLLVVVRRGVLDLLA
jgi:hypothetical protein